ncbi:MAG: anion permease [Eggerthellaceae bacterium]|nr:anion permease [Eggerthellaceae bacterium]
MISPAVIALLITGLCVVFWVTRILPMAVTGLIGLILMVLTGAASFDVAFSGFGNSIVVLMAGALVVGIAMLKTGVGRPPLFIPTSMLVPHHFNLFLLG